jgi:ferredoxin
MALTSLGSLSPPQAPIVIDACQGCGACILTCPERALRPAPGNPALILSRCTACGECIEICPVDAIRFAGPRACHPAGDPRNLRHSHDRKA